ncbi:S1 domain-containing post-transcriptional regulator GSP13 [Anoxybacteroides amylolyticum]|uniref:General stress protein 13 n=1 Tax=Anoxybacteroides amylolyticum TaxID=294699 RepID=A0A160F5R6_9BACL|nr:S1 domain-containing post-transcriptional regulator GSP13 [Anoxybacillus amylolyticus]ANB61786.1 general stress protein 13 [Anoxybacillus amylolyticus]
MSKLAVGSIVKGTVTGIQPYGAFVAISDDIQGLVHISEVSHQFVKDIHDFLKVGDEVMVKILSIDEKAKRASLSIRSVKEIPASDKLRQPKAKELPETAGGFHILKEKLKEWVEQSQDE